MGCIGTYTSKAQGRFVSKVGSSIIQVISWDYSFFITSGHVHAYERTWPVADNRATSMDYENPSSLVALIVGNAGEAEGNAGYNAAASAEELPDWKAFHYDGYGFSTVKATPSSLEFTHKEAKLDGSLGRIIDQFTIHKEQDDNEN